MEEYGWFICFLFNDIIKDGITIQKTETLTDIINHPETMQC
jgi:hypothetical protein